jgi:transcription antitermination factor NusG
MGGRVVTRIETDGLTWIAIRADAFCEFMVADELNGHGIVGYCPTGARFSLRQGNKRVRRVIHFPVFARYIFAGLAGGQFVRRTEIRRIESILSDAAGHPLTVPRGAIRRINDDELSGAWDSTRQWAEHAPYRPGDLVSIKDGAFAGFPATVDAISSESRIRLLIELFGRPTTVLVASCQIAAV